MLRDFKSFNQILSFNSNFHALFSMVFKFKMSGVNEYQRVRHRENCPLGKDLAA